MNTITIGICGNSCKAHSFECKTQMYLAINIMEDEVWERMRNIPKKFLYKRSHCPGNEKRAGGGNKQSYLPAKENHYLLLSFMIPISILI